MKFGREDVGRLFYTKPVGYELTGTRPCATRIPIIQISHEANSDRVPWLGSNDEFDSVPQGSRSKGDAAAGYWLGR